MPKSNAVSEGLKKEEYKKLIGFIDARETCKRIRIRIGRARVSEKPKKEWRAKHTVINPRVSAERIIRVSRGKTMYKALMHFKVTNRCETCDKVLIRASRHMQCETNGNERERKIGKGNARRELE